MQAWQPTFRPAVAVALATSLMAWHAEAQLAPYVHTQPAGPVSATSATLNGMVVPNGSESVAWFEWGERGGYAQTTPSTNVGAGTTVVRVSASISNLVAVGTYQCRLVVSNVTTVAYGAIKLFTTGDRVAGWGNNSYGAATPPTGLSNAVAIAAARDHSLVIRSDGTVLGWGENQSGSGTSPPGLSNVVALASGYSHSVALRSDSSVVAWGDSSYNKTNVPANLTNAVAIACGGSHSLALRLDGTMVAWGYNGYSQTGQATVPNGLSNVVAIACGNAHNLVLIADGTVRAWGENYYGKTDVPIGLSNVVEVAGGYDHSLALRKDGTVVAWGYNAYGQTYVPPGLSNAIAIAGWGNLSIALRMDGTIVTWGSSSDSSYTPAGLSNLVAIAAGRYHVLAIGNVRPGAQSQFAYGPANHDLVIQFNGSDLNADVLSFRVTSLPASGALYQFNAGVRGPLIASPGTWVSDPGGRTIFAPAADEFGSSYASFNFVANDGRSDSDAASVTVHIQESRAFTQPASRIGPTQARLNGMALANSFAATAWFEWGERGGYNQTTAPQSVGNGTDVVRLTETLSSLPEGRTHQFRLVISNEFGLKRGALQWFTTGDRFAELGGDNYVLTTGNTNVTNVVAVAVGDAHSLLLRNDGTVLAWGSNNYGQTNVPAGLSNAIAIAGGQYHSLALRGDGTVLAWGGYNIYGSMAAPAGLSNVIAISAGGYHNLALRADGTVVAWGWNYYGQTNVPPGLSNVVAIAGGRTHSLALKADGTLVAWGENSNSLMSLPAGLNEVVALTSSLGLRYDGSVVTLGVAAGQTNPPAGLSNVVAISGSSLALTQEGTVVGWEYVVGYYYIMYVTLPAGLTNMVAIAGNPGRGLVVGDARPEALRQIVFGGANQDLVIGLEGFDANGQSLSFRIATLPANGSLFQYANGFRGAAITATNTPVSDPESRVIFAPAANGFGSPYDSISYLANDGGLDSPPADVTIHIQHARAFTQSATDIRPTRATLNGMALPNGFAAAAWFEWGERGSFAYTTPPVLVGDGHAVVHVRAAVSNLNTGGTYQCRLVVSNVNGVVHGATRLFTTGDRVRAWGDNYSGQTNVPAGLNDGVAVAAGGNHSIALRADGTVRVWGYGNYGITNVPAGLSNVVAVAGGSYHVLALQSDGTVVAWGAGGPGQTNSPHYGQSTVPSGLSNVVAVAAGSDHSVALREDGTVVAWGRNTYEQTNVPAGLSNVVAVAAGQFHNLALRADGTVAVWGGFTGSAQDMPFGLNDVVAVSGGDTHSMALRQDGSIAQWGVHYIESEYPGGLAPVPSSFTNGLAIASGDWHSLALQQDGTVMSWGVAYYNQLSVPQGLQGVIAIAAAGFHNLAIGGQQRPVAGSQLLTGPANHDLELELVAVDGDGDPLTLRIASPPAMGTLYQYTNGNRGAAVTTSDAIVTDAEGRLVFAPFANGFGHPYASFTFIANDGSLDSTPATVTLNIEPPVAPEVTSFSRDPNGTPQLVFTGDSNTTYCVWASTNLVNWEYLGLAIQNLPGSFLFSDFTAGVLPRRFYRISTGCGTPPPQLSAASGLTSEGFEFHFIGGAYWTYRVWASTNLVDWELLGGAQEVSPGVFRYLDDGAAARPQRFYRAGAP